jgi:hypothetical protein
MGQPLAFSRGLGALPFGGHRRFIMFIAHKKAYPQTICIPFSHSEPEGGRRGLAAVRAFAALSRTLANRSATSRSVPGRTCA